MVFKQQSMSRCPQTAELEGSRHHIGCCIDRRRLNTHERRQTQSTTILSGTLLILKLEPKLDRGTSRRALARDC